MNICSLSKKIVILVNLLIISRVVFDIYNVSDSDTDLD
jgi:hypothetical protein